MKPDSRLRTGWICIATEGNSIDGRYISREILTEMAESYDPEHYCALIWPDHNHYGNNAGTVEALKAEAVDGKMKLFAVLRPTRDLIYWNQIGQYQFCSIEPKADFAESGKFYLGGLGVTDRPASTGTTQMQFSAKKPDEPRFIGQSEDLNLNAFAEQGREEGMFKKFMAWFKTQEEPPAPHATTPEDPAMDEKQFNELKGLIGGIADKQTELEGKIETFSKKEEPAPTKEPEQKTEPEQPASGVTAEQFSELLTAVKGVAAKQGELETQFSSLLKEQPGQIPSGAPAGGDNYHVV